MARAQDGVTPPLEFGPFHYLIFASKKKERKTKKEKIKRKKQKIKNAFDYIVMYIYKTYEPFSQHKLIHI